MPTIAAIKLSAQTATATVGSLHPWGDLFWELLAYLNYCVEALPGQRVFFQGLKDYLEDSNEAWCHEKEARQSPFFES